MNWKNAFCWASFFFLASCTGSREVQPENPIWGKEACGHCNMLVSEQHPSAQAVLSDGARRYFDDVGCLSLFLETEKAAPKGVWVNDGKGGWVKASEARFVSGQRTPMDFGFLFQPQGPLGFEDVRKQVRERKAHHP